MPWQSCRKPNSEGVRSRSRNQHSNNNILRVRSELGYTGLLDRTNSRWFNQENRRPRFSDDLLPMDWSTLQIWVSRSSSSSSRGDPRPGTASNIMIPPGSRRRCHPPPRRTATTAVCDTGAYRFLARRMPNRPRRTPRLTRSICATATPRAVKARPASAATTTLSMHRLAPPSALLPWMTRATPRRHPHRGEITQKCGEIRHFPSPIILFLAEGFLLDCLYLPATYRCVVVVFLGKNQLCINRFKSSL